MPKLTIYLPDALAEDVRETGISVSPICQRALEREINRMKLQAQASSDIKAAARRLAAATNEEDEENARKGAEAGRDWALEKAAPRELRAVSAMVYDSGIWQRITCDDAWPTLLDALIDADYVDPEDYNTYSGELQIVHDAFTGAFFVAAAETYEEILKTSTNLDT